MKKLFFLAAIAVMGFTTAQAQISFGGKAGVNFASLSGDGSENSEGVTKFHLGAVANFGITEFLSIQPEILYSSQGYKQADNDDIRVNLDYLNIPIMADFILAEGFSLQGGPQIGININSELDFDGETADIEDVETLDIGVGIGAQYKLADNGLFFQARYVTGLTEFIEDSEAKIGVISLSLGYMFN